MKRKQYSAPALRIVDLALSGQFLVGSANLDSSIEPLVILEDDSSNWSI